MDPQLYKQCEEEISKEIQHFGSYLFVYGEQYRSPCYDIKLYFPYINSGYKLKTSVEVIEDAYKEASFARVITLSK
jgi:hypothetical protein